MKPPAFQFYPKDFLSDINVQMMTMEERGVYITLLCSAWIEGEIPDDIIILKRLCKYKNIESTRVLEVWFNVTSTFVKKDGFLLHPRLERERIKQDEWKEKCRKGGLQSPKNKEDRKGTLRVAEQPFNSSSSSSSSTTKETSTNVDVSPKRKTSAPARPPQPFFSFDEKAWINITGEDLARWDKAYPAVNVIQQLTEMEEWLLSNPDKRKKNYRAFITRWLSKEQDHGGDKPSKKVEYRASQIGKTPPQTTEEKQRSDKLAALTLQCLENAKGKYQKQIAIARQNGDQVAYDEIQATIQVEASRDFNKMTGGER